MPPPAWYLQRSYVTGSLIEGPGGAELFCPSTMLAIVPTLLLMPSLTRLRR